MGFLTDIFTSGFSSVVKEVGSVIDNIHTSDDEKAKAKLELTREIQSFQVELIKAQAQYDAEITKRWESDNEHAITRLVRPLSFAFVLGLFAIVILSDGNLGAFTINPAYIPVIEGLLYTMVIAYFGSRGAEKITKTIKPKPVEKPDTRTTFQRNFDNEVITDIK